MPRNTTTTIDLGDEYRVVRREECSEAAYAMRMRVIALTCKTCTLQSVNNAKYVISGRLLDITGPKMQSCIIPGYDAIFSCDKIKRKEPKT